MPAVTRDGGTAMRNLENAGLGKGKKKKEREKRKEGNPSSEDSEEFDEARFEESRAIQVRGRIRGRLRGSIASRVSIRKYLRRRFRFHISCARARGHRRGVIAIAQGEGKVCHSFLRRLRIARCDCDSTYRLTITMERLRERLQDSTGYAQRAIRSH